MLKPSKQSTIKSCWYNVEGNAKSVVLYRKHIMWETRKSSWILLQKFGKRCAMRLSDLRSCTSLFMSQVTCNWQIEQNGSPSIEETSFCFLCFKPLRVHLNSVLHRKKALRGVVGAFAVHNTLMQNVHCLKNLGETSDSPSSLEMESFSLRESTFCFPDISIASAPLQSSN